MQTCLIIDDDSFSLELLRALLNRLGDCHVVGFTTPLEALVWSKNNLPDLVIVDYIMLPIDGLEFMARFRRIEGRESVPAIMITAADIKDVRYEALQNGIHDFLGKPLDKLELSARVRNLLALNKNQKLRLDQTLHLETLVQARYQAVMNLENELVERMMQAVTYRDGETGAHIARVAKYSLIIARGLGLSKGDQDILHEAAAMHDAGMIAVPDEILRKRGGLTQEELGIMKRHAQVGYDLLRGSKSSAVQAGAEIALTHHERLDGKGYPRGLKGEQIPLFSRIVAVADTFDELTSGVWNGELSPLRQAATYLREQAGSAFDPACVNAFLADWDEVLAIHADLSRSCPNLFPEMSRCEN
jgi:putative two-component system response regulator